MEEIARVIALKGDIMNMNMTSSSKRVAREYIHLPPSPAWSRESVIRLRLLVSFPALPFYHPFVSCSLHYCPSPWLHQTRMLSTPQGWRRCSPGHLPIRGHQSTRYRQWEENLLVMVDLWLKSSLLTVVYDSDRSSFWVALFTVSSFRKSLSVYSELLMNWPCTPLRSIPMKIAYLPIAKRW